VVKKSIFIQIASYRDPELNNTISDCLIKAEHPDRLRFGVCLQRDINDKEWDNLDDYLEDSRFKIIDVPYLESKGACWARAKVQALYDGEDYTLQLDSHHRFVNGWDTKLIDMLESLKSKSPKPIITAYVPEYDPETERKIDSVWEMTSYKLKTNGIVLFRPKAVDNWGELTAPIKSKFYSGHFMFTLGCHCDEVKYDPDLYFTGEEMTMGARSYTYGYDLYHPHIPIAWHEYTRKGRTKHWDDFQTKKLVPVPFHEMDGISKSRVKTVLGQSNDVDVGKYGLGPVRSLQDYCDYSEVDWPTNMLYDESVVGEKEEYPYPLDWAKLVDKLTGEFDLLAIIIDDKHRNTLYRKDVTDKSILDGRDHKLVATLTSGDCPHKLVLLRRNTKTNQWLSKIEMKLKDGF